MPKVGLSEDLLYVDTKKAVRRLRTLVSSLKVEESKMQLDPAPPIEQPPPAPAPEPVSEGTHSGFVDLILERYIR